MSFPRYPKYKDSGVEWLGQVPEHWDVRPVAALATIINGYPFDSERFDPAVGYPLIRIRDLGSDQAEAYYNGEMVERATVTSADVLIGMDGDFNVGRWRGAGIAMLNQRMCCIRGSTPLVTRLLEYALPRPLANINAVTYSTTVKHLSSSQVEKIRVAIPPAEVEREAIAAFLDRETAKIDALIAEQQRLIELLQEKRQAVVSHAVTKGLNPDAAMKDSGIEWLGKVPEHWQCVRNKVVFNEVDDRSKTEDGELLTVSHITGVTPRSEKDVNMFMAETFVGYKKCCGGDLVINTMWAWMGALGCAKCDGIVSPSYNVYRPRDQAVLWPDYYDDLCRVPSHRIAIKARSTGIWESRLRLYPDAFLGMSMPLPPFGEQQEIAAFVDRQTSQWDSLMAEAELAITLLQERRSALISAAVTGQIDVRGFSSGGSEAA